MFFKGKNKVRRTFSTIDRNRNLCLSRSTICECPFYTPLYTRSRERPGVHPVIVKNLMSAFLPNREYRSCALLQMHFDVLSPYIEKAGFLGTIIFANRQIS